MLTDDDCSSIYKDPIYLRSNRIRNVVTFPVSGFCLPRYTLTVCSQSITMATSTQCTSKELSVSSSGNLCVCVRACARNISYYLPYITCILCYITLYLL